MDRLLSLGKGRLVLDNTLLDDARAVTKSVALYAGHLCRVMAGGINAFYVTSDTSHLLVLLSLRGVLLLSVRAYQRV